ncbi:hypothetical protein D3C73_1548760 [compost metagenome]
MIGADEQHGQASQGDQAVGNEVQRQGIDEQQHQAAGGDQQDLAKQQPVQRMWPERGEETIGKHQAAGCGH